jgi:hypothetical protein
MPLDSSASRLELGGQQRKKPADVEVAFPKMGRGDGTSQRPQEARRLQSMADRLLDSRCTMVFREIWTSPVGGGPSNASRFCCGAQGGPRQIYPSFRRRAADAPAAASAG